MSSTRQIAANRRNGRKGRGPKTDAGKARSRHNARRHGLSVIGSANPNHASKIGEIAMAILGSESDPFLSEPALQFAESGFILRGVRYQRVVVIE